MTLALGSSRGGAGRRPGSSSLGLALLAITAAACASPSSTPSGDDHDDGPNPAPACTPGLARSAAARLTHRQWARTVEDLLGLSTGDADAFTQGFTADPRTAGFDTGSSGLRVSAGLGRGYQTAAELLVDRVVTDARLFDALVPCDPAASSGDVCPRRFVEGFLARAFRRPPTGAEVERYLAAFDEGAALPEDTDTAFQAGARLVLEAALQSPKMLYRLEPDGPPAVDAPTPAAPDTDGARALDGYEVASRLSYFLWNTMPDDELFAAAEAGDLVTAEEVRAQATRMVDDPRARDVVLDFHEQWLRTREWNELIRDPEQFPNADDALPGSMREEARRFVSHVVLDQRRGLRALLTSRTTFVDGALAAVYGVSPPSDDGFAEVTLDATRRAGLLTQSGFLAFHADRSDPSPIKRGVYVQREVLCTKIPDPPGDADLDLPPRGGEIYTNRERVEAHTSPEGCQVCHGIINPTGFAFENYDALGGWRDADNGVPVDATAAIPLPGEDALEAAHAVDLVEALAERPDVHRCYATRLVRYGLGREDRASDACLLDRLQTLGLEGASVLELLVELAASEAMRFRAPAGPLDDPGAGGGA